jgi:hypothetical protein
MIPEASDAIAFPGEYFRSELIPMCGIVMLPPVGFNDKLCLHACEIRDKPAEPHLSAKLETLELPAAQMLPKELLGLGHLAP